MGTIPFVGSQEEPVFKITLIAMGKQYSTMVLNGKLSWDESSIKTLVYLLLPFFSC